MTEVKTAGKSSAIISVVADDLVIRFPYSKLRFNQIKSLKEARYDKTNRCWVLPVDHLERLEKLKSFSPTQIVYNFDKAALQSRISELTTKRTHAQEQIRSNPFAVPVELCELAQVPIVFSAASAGQGIRVKLRRMTRVKAALESIPGVSYIEKNREYLFPVELLTVYLKNLKQDNILFAVEQELGDQLKQTARLRTELLSGKRLGTWQELRKSFLLPYVKLVTDRNGVLGFGLFDWTTEQLRKLIPDIAKFSERKQKSLNFSISELLQILEHSTKTNINVWLDGEVVQQLNKHFAAYFNQSTIPNGLVNLIKPELCWMVGAQAAAQLTVRADLSINMHELDQSLASLGFKHVDYQVLVWARTYQIDAHNALAAVAEIAQIAKQLNLELSITTAFEQLTGDLQMRQEALSKQQYYLALNDTQLPELDEEIGKKLFPHQRVGVAWLLETSQALLGDDMGLGKTLMVLTAFHILQKSNLVDFICVVCPRSLVTNWQHEADNWFDDLKITKLPDSRAAQTKFFKTFSPGFHASGIVINFETFRLARIYPELVKIATNKRVLLVVDESQRVKNPQSQAFKALAQIAEKAARRVLLSGTPTPNDLSDIWAQMYLLDQGQRLGRNYFTWLTEVAELGNKWSEYAVKRFIPDQVEKVKLRVHEVLLRRKKEDVVDLPPKLFSFRELELTGSQLARYEEVRQELLLRVSNVDGDEYLKEISSILEEFLRAVQVASNPRLIDANWTGEPVKFLELDEIIKEVVESQSGKIVVWTNFVGNVKELLLRYKAYGSCAIYGEVKANERAAVVKDFQSSAANSAKVLIAIPAAGGVGITLTAARTAVYLDRTWNAEHWLQSIDRIHRIGQSGTVSIITLNACLIDFLIARSLKKKYFAQKDLLEPGHMISNVKLPARSELLAALHRN